MRIRYIFKGEERKFESALDSIIVGRPKLNVPFDLDLTPDSTVSRPHARISFEDGQHWIEDLGSLVGTFVDASDIKGCGKVRLPETSSVQIGGTTLFLEPSADSKTTATVVANAKISPILQPKEPAILARIPAAGSESPQDGSSFATASGRIAVTRKPVEPVTSGQQRVLYDGCC